MPENRAKKEKYTVFNQRADYARFLFFDAEI